MSFSDLWRFLTDCSFSFKSSKYPVPLAMLQLPSQFSLSCKSKATGLTSLKLLLGLQTVCFTTRFQKQINSPNRFQSNFFYSSFISSNLLYYKCFRIQLCLLANNWIRKRWKACTGSKDINRSCQDLKNVYIYTIIHVCAYICIFMYIYLCAYICICIQVNTSYWDLKTWRFGWWGFETFFEVYGYGLRYIKMFLIYFTYNAIFRLKLWKFRV